MLTPYCWEAFNIYGNEGPGNLRRDHRIFWRGHRVCWGLTLRGYRLFQCRISTESKIILEFSHTVPWNILRLYLSFSYQKYGAIINLYYGAINYFGWRFQWCHAEVLTKRIQSHTLFSIFHSRFTRNSHRSFPGPAFTQAVLLQGFLTGPRGLPKSIIPSASIS